MVKLSKSQILLILNMQENEVDHEYYAETGIVKPFDKRTITAMEKRGYINVVRTACGDSIFYCKRGKNFDQIQKLSWSDYNKAK